MRAPDVLFEPYQESGAVFALPGKYGVTMGKFGPVERREEARVHIEQTFYLHWLGIFSLTSREICGRKL